MSTPSIESVHRQLDLLDAAGASAPATVWPASLKQPRPSAQARIAARGPSMVATDSLFECATNPRTEFPDGELDELAEDIRQHGILQPIVVHPADAAGRHRIHFGAKRWRAAQRIGLPQVPVVVRDTPADPYEQVAENQKRHGLTPLDLARFIRGRIDAGETNTGVANRLGMDLTTLAHHLALLDLPPVVDAALQAGRCTSPRTLFELSRLHSQRPDSIADLLASTVPITREAVAKIRRQLDHVPLAERVQQRTDAPAREVARLMVYASGLCDKLDHALARLAQADGGVLLADDRVALCKRIEEVAARLRTAQG